MGKKPETKIEDKFVDWVRDYPLPAIALKLVIFAQRGWPDRTVMCKGRIFFIEFKTPDGDQSKMQIIWMNRIRRLGFSYYVCTSVEEAIEAFYQEIT